MMNKEDPQIQAVLRHQTAKALHSMPKEAEAYLTEAGTKDLITNDLPRSATWKANTTHYLCLLNIEHVVHILYQVHLHNAIIGHKV